MFTCELSEDKLEKLKDFFLLRKTRNLSIWVYDASSLELITSKFSSAHKAAEFFNVDYRSILAHMDTYKPSIKNGKSVLIFNNELSEGDKKALTKNFKLWTNEKTLLYVTRVSVPLLCTDKKIKRSANGLLFTPINYNIPNTAGKIKSDLHIDINTLRKYTDTDKSYKGLYFYSMNLNK